VSRDGSGDAAAECSSGESVIARIDVVVSETTPVVVPSGSGDDDDVDRGPRLVGDAAPRGGRPGGGGAVAAVAAAGPRPRDRLRPPAWL
jgi:hypothetical protein